MPSFAAEQDSPLTAWGQVHRDLRRRIETGEFAPGSRIPSEAALVEHYGMSRMTVRRAIEALVTDGYLHRRRGAGTFVNARDDLLRCEVDLLRPWRDQLLATGHVARSRLLEYSAHAQVAEELKPSLGFDRPEQLSFGLHLQEVNGIPIALTESWLPTGKGAGIANRPRAAVVSASSVVAITFATSAQARLLAAYHDASLLEIVAVSRLRETGELVELARTHWVANRVRATYQRRLTVGQIDMSELLPGTG